MRDVPPPIPITKLEIVADIPAGMEVASEAALRVTRYLNSLGAVAKVTGQVEVVSPSILTDYLPGLDGIYKLVVTEDTIKEFFRSREELWATTYLWNPLHSHALFWHNSIDGYLRKQRHSSWVDRVPLEQCSCPLRGTHYTGEYEIGGVGLDPYSLIEARDQWGDNPPVQLSRFGPKSFTNLGRVVDRLTQDLGDAGLLGDPVL